MPRAIGAIFRHGRYQQPVGVPSAHLPHPLTPDGEEDVRRGAAELIREVKARDWDIDPVIESSSLLRAWMTASILADELQRDLRKPFEVRQSPYLAERGLGAAANLTEAEIEAAVARDPRHSDLATGWKRDPQFTLPFIGAESLLTAGRRVAAYIESVMMSWPPPEELDRTGAAPAGIGRHSRGRDTVTVFVGHGGSLRFSAVALGVMSAEQATARSMFHARPVFLERCAIGEWQHLAGAWKPRTSAVEHSMEVVV